MQHLAAFILSEGNKYQILQPCSQYIYPHKAPNSPEKGLDGWAYMMRTPDKSLTLLYFENLSVKGTLIGFIPYKIYHFKWFNPRTGVWKEKIPIKADKNGMLLLPDFPGEKPVAATDWAAKLVAVETSGDN